ncbi:hypothetical protein T07_5994 [Trichinella nelsoni]|uniref:Uncharacterized protein n=1 Tax=Trichinella nelsoni TaxID=6336 RepID=A0A0V0RVN6_9BILA|nr:hypothetical protein T07_5994 [Trichinella nelsoni]
MGKGGHSSSHSHSSTRSNSGGRSGHSHSSKGGKSEKTGVRPTQTKIGSDANRPLSKSPIRSDASISSKDRGERERISSNASQVQHSRSERNDTGHRNDASHLARSQKRKVTSTATSIGSVFKSLDQYSQHHSKDRPDTSHRSESRSSESGRNRRRNKRRRSARKWRSTITESKFPFSSLDQHSQNYSTDGSDESHRSESRRRRNRKRRERRRRRRRSIATGSETPFSSLNPDSDHYSTDESDTARRRTESQSSESRRSRRRRNRRRSARRRRRRSRARSKSHLRHQCGGRCEMPELFSCSCLPGIYCEDCFRTMRRSFRDKFECSLSKRNVLMLPNDGKVYLLSPSGHSMFQKLYVQVKSPYDASTFCTAAKYPSERFNFSGRDEEISRKVLKKLHFKHHRTRKGRRNPKRGRGT